MNFFVVFILIRFYVKKFYVWKTEIYFWRAVDKSCREKSFMLEAKNVKEMEVKAQ